ncbi:QRFP-like peptide receptor [Tachypleus tridentatus]|uniref:QRFP-like peptide receptor n=1 Tax=Tachypleus tridentatus TaxID=6853 RepID=UPI003FD4D0ED
MSKSKVTTQIAHSVLYELTQIRANCHSDNMDNLSPFKRFVLPAMYGILFLLVCGCSLVVVVTIAAKKSLHRPMNSYVISLCLSDCIIASVIIIVKVYSTFNTMSSNLLCTLYRCSYFAEMALFNSIFSVVAIAIDRHDAIVRPLKGTFTNQRALRHVALIWFMGFVYSFPKYVVVTVRHYQTKAMKNISDHIILNHCMFDQEVALILNILDVVVVYLLPLGTVTLLYSRAVRVLRQCDHDNTPHLQVLNGRRQRAIKMIIIITITFSISWLPYHVLSIISRDPFRGMSSVMIEARNILCIVCIILILLNGWLNVIVYGYLNEDFRLAFRSLLRRRFTRGYTSNRSRRLVSVSSAALMSSISSRSSEVSIQSNMEVRWKKITWPQLNTNSRERPSDVTETSFVPRAVLY